MNLTEVLVAALVFTVGATTSAQLWGASAAWSRSAEQRQLELQRLDLDLLRQERSLGRMAAELRSAREMADPPAPPLPSCEVARDQLISLAEPERTAELRADSGSAEGGLWLVVRTVRPGSAPIERRRLFMPAAHGLCLD